MLELRNLLNATALMLALLASGCGRESACRSEAPVANTPVAAVPGETYVKTELYFGLSRPGGVVSEAEWKTFLDAYITPAFPDGLTVVDGYGQWKNDAGKIVSENSKVLILIHKPGAEANAKLDAIISAYKKQFQQESVLRVTTAATVTF